MEITKQRLTEIKERLKNLTDSVPVVIHSHELLELIDRYCKSPLEETLQEQIKYHKVAYEHYHARVKELEEQYFKGMIKLT